MTPGSAGTAPASRSISSRVLPSTVEILTGTGMTEPATDKSMITTTRRSGTETGNSSGSRAARKNSGPDGVRRQPPSSAGKPLHGAVLLAALGIVYGDIGTSPIYTFRECL